MISGPLPGASGSSVGGVAVHTAKLAEELACMGRHVLVLDDSHHSQDAPRSRPNAEHRSLNADQVHFDSVGVRGASRSTMLSTAMRTPGSSLAVLQRALASSWRRNLEVPLPTAVVRSLLISASARRMPSAVLHIQQADYRPLYADWAGLTQHRVITVHGLGSLENPRNPHLREATLHNLASAAAIAVPSNALATELTALGILPDRIHAIPNGVDHTVFRERSREECRASLGIDPLAPLAVYAGRLTRHKGVTDLLDAWNSVHSSLPQAMLALVGPPGDEIRIDAPNISATGAVSPEATATWLGAADVVVVPSRYEGFGLSALEAMASARPVVATNVGGLPEVVAPGAGALVPAGDPPALAAALLRFLSDDDAALAAGAAGASAAGAYSWSMTATAYSELYDAVLKDGVGQYGVATR